MYPTAIRSTPNDIFEVEFNHLTHKLVYVHATSEYLDPADLYPDDLDALGLWAVVVPLDLEASLVANCALDAFNMAVPIKWTSTIELAVYGEPKRSKVLERDEVIDWYSLQDRAAGVYFIAHLG